MMVSFPPYRLDVGEERLWRGAKLLAVRRKPFAILRYLATNPRRLVTHRELLDHVWGDVVVSESAVRTHLHDLRQVLGDGVIETVIGRGYRFTAELADDAAAVAAAAAVVATLPEPAAAAPERLVVGRDAELDALRAGFDRARAGQRQVVFVTGEPGIGKTTLVDRFVAELEDTDGVVAVRGQCVEQHGTPEAYLAIIDVLAQLRRSELGDQVLAAMLRHAPTFLAQLPHLVPDDLLDEVNRRARAGSDARTVRELIEVLEAIAADRTIAIVLEDLQWSDVATIDLLAVLAQRRDRARMLVIATARRAEAQTVAHPLNRVMRTLVARGCAGAVALDRIEASDVGRFVALRFPGHGFSDGFLAALDRMTGGTPLFVVSVLDDLVARGMIRQDAAGRWELTASIAEVAAHRPDSVKQMIDIQLDRLTADEQRALEAASVIGAEFPTALVAAAVETTVEQTDELCEGLARRGLFVRRAASEDWPDGSCQTRFAVTHGLVQEVCVGRAAPARRQRWHRLIAEHLDRVFGAAPDDMAKILATHFDLGQVPGRAVHYYIVAAERTSARHASRDALRLYRRALELVRRLPESAERDTTELRILTGMSPAVLRVTGEAGRESIDDFERMVAIARRLGEPAAVCGALVNLAFRHSTMAEYAKAAATYAAFRAEADAAGAAAGAGTIDPAVLSLAEAARGLFLFWRGELVEVTGVYDGLTGPIGPAQVYERGALGVLGVTDRTTVLMTYASMVRWLRGHGDRAIAESRRAIELAEAANDPYTLGLALVHSARLRMFRGDPIDLVCAPAEHVLATPELELWHSPAAILLGWARSHVAPLDAAAADALLRELRLRIGGFPMGRTYLGLGVVDALQRSGRAGEATTLLAELLEFARARDERVFAPELHRLHGDLLAPADPEAAAIAYQAGIALADAIDAPALALRAANALARLWQGTARAPDALAIVARALGAITEGHDAGDIVVGRRLLSERPAR